MTQVRATSALLLVAALSVLAFPAQPLLAQSGEGQVGLPIGTPGPDAAVQDLDGNDQQLLAVIDGRPALIEFWATWCEQCEALQPQLDAIHERFAGDLAVVAVAVAVAQSQRRVQRHVQEHGAGYPYLWDGRGEAVRAYQAPTTSVVVLLDEGGKVAYTGVGSEQDLVGAVETLLGAESGIRQ